MEYYKNRLCVTYNELTEGDPDDPDVCRRPVMSKSMYNKLVGSRRIMAPRRGSNGRCALIDYHSLPDRIKERYVSKYGDPTEKAKDDSLRRRIVKDFKAEAFFRRHSPLGCDYSTLDPKFIREYTQNASVLNAVIELVSDMTVTVSKTNGNKSHIWNVASQLANNLRDEFGHRLPRKPIPLKRKAVEYMKDGYIALVSGKLNNPNARKDKEKEQRALMSELLGNGRNLDNAQIAKFYNLTAERMNWPPVSPATVANYRKQYTEAYAGRHGAKAYYDNIAMQAKRKRPSAPMLMWSADGWDTELLYQEVVIDKKGHKVRAYHNRPTVVAVIDPVFDYIVGYAIGKNENPALIREAFRNAFYHVHELFGSFYKPLQIQTDNYAKKKLTPMYEGSTDKYTPAAVGNAKAKPIEPYFLQFNRRQFREKRNSSGYGVKSGELKQPSPDFIEANKRYFPGWDGVCEQIHIGVERERAEKRDEYIARFNRLDDSKKMALTEVEFLRLYGERSDRPHKLHGHGITLQIDGEKHVYDCFHPEFRNYGYKKFFLAYDPSNMQQVLAIVAGGTERDPEETGIHFTLEEKYIQPMALADRREGDFEQLQRIRDYNRERVDEIIELRRSNMEIIQKMYDENSDRLLVDTTMKMIITDSRGQHKDVRNAALGRGEKIELPVSVESQTAGTGDEYEYDVIFDPRESIMKL